MAAAMLSKPSKKKIKNSAEKVDQLLNQIQ